jgi:hypothetical protein
MTIAKNVWPNRVLRPEISVFVWFSSIAAIGGREKSHGEAIDFGIICLLEG